MIPLILLDLDGTLIGTSAQVQDCVWRGAERARSAGIKLAVCTGRPCAGVAQKVAMRLGPRNPHIFQSGAMIAYPDGEAIKVFALKEAVTRQLIEHAREHGLVLEVYTPNAMYVERRTPLSETHAKMIGVSAIVRDLLDVVENEPVVRAQWVLKPEQLEHARKLELPGVEMSSAISPAMPDTIFTSITQEGVSKGTAAVHLSQVLKVGVENVMGIGDSWGDLPMLEEVGHPLVMASAPDELKARFEALPGDVENCGVVEAFERALKQKAVS